MAYIRKHRKKWQALVRKKKIVVVKSFLKKGDARKWADKIEAQIEVGSYLEVKKSERLNEIKVYELLDIFFDKFKRKSKNIRNFTYEINHMKRQSFSNLFLSQLTPRILAEFRDQQLDLGKSGATVNKYLGLVSRAVNLGRRELDIPITFNPISLVQKAKANRKVDRPCSDEDWERLLELSLTAYPKGNRTDEERPLYFMKQIMIFARETLMRQAELFRLRKRDIDFAKGTALILETKNDTPRRIGLSPKAIQILHNLPTTIDGRYFPVRDRFQFYAHWSVLTKRADVDISFHTLRHLGATDLIYKQGWSIAEVQAQGGWKTLTALQRYLDIRGEELATKLQFNREA